MRKLIATSFIVLLLGTTVLSGSYTQDSLNIPIKTMHSKPSEQAKVVLDIPIEVKVLDVSADLNWYKVKIAYKIGPFEQNHTGWIKIPFDDILLAL
ncbi:MAG: hypothetical protein ABID35_06375 [Candidatus Margulisiibacteriota bacterium]